VHSHLWQPEYNYTDTAAQHTFSDAAVCVYIDKDIIQQMVDKIANDVVVTMTYRMIVDGKEVESAPADEPLYYLHGSDNIVPGLETALEGKTVGDKVSVTLAPEDAYGMPDDEDIQELPLEDFDLPNDVKLGDEVEIEDADGDVFVAIITAIGKDTITLDFNNPMAGKTITFEAEVLELREATEEEIEFGEPEEYAELYDYDDHDDHDHDH
jgi:FKBP-type peptidyl-prolyl cis-trans isomerase SlyD